MYNTMSLISEKMLQNPHALLDKGIQKLQKLAGATWTDHNVHDPGITILEQLAYALADLNYRTAFDIKDLLTVSPESGQEPHRLFTAREILPGHAVTLTDYRKLILDIEGIRNVWVVPAKQPGIIYKNPYRTALHHLPYRLNAAKADTLELRGLYKVLLDFDLDVNGEQAAAIKETVWNRLMNNRNMGEDFLEPETVIKEDIGLTSEIELETHASPEESLAELYYQLDNFLMPSPRFYPLEELLDKGIPPHRIFEGPALNHGFLLTEELPKHRTMIHTSDLVQIMMDITGVKAVRNLHGASYPQGVLFRSGQRWCIRLNPGLNYSPRLDPSKCHVKFIKNGIAYQADTAQVMQLLQAKQQKDREARYALSSKNDIAIPQGRYRNLHQYFSVQDDFPLNYGIGEEGLPSRATPLRRAQAKQLKAYLLLFEKLMADYQAQLTHAGSLFSNNFSGITTYFSQQPEATETTVLYTDDMTEVPQEDPEAAGKRTVRLIDHKLGRLGEQVSEYPLLASGISGAKDMASEIQDKLGLLQDFPIVSSARAKGVNYEAPQLGTDNVSGLYRKVCRLLGIAGLNPGRLTETVSLFEVYQSESNGDWRFRLKDPQETILLYSNKGYAAQNDCLSAVEIVMDRGPYAENYVLNTSADGKYYLALHAEDGELIARGTLKDQEETVNNTVLEINKLLSPEGLYLVEHILLRPEITALGDTVLGKDHFFPIYADNACNTPWEEDPYSFIATVVMPGWGVRFANNEFRRYAENVIHEAAPAHLKIHIHWVGRTVMTAFENAYWNWVENLSVRRQQPLAYTQQVDTLVTAIKNMHYEKGIIGNFAPIPEQSTPFADDDVWKVFDKFMQQGIGGMRISKNFIVHPVRSTWRTLADNSIVQLAYSGKCKRGDRGLGVMTVHDDPVPDTVEALTFEYIMGTDPYAEAGLIFDWAGEEDYKLFYYSQYEKKVILTHVKSGVIDGILDTPVEDLAGAPVTLTIEEDDHTLICKQRSPDTIGAEFRLNSTAFPKGKQLGLFTRYCDNANFRRLRLTGPSWVEERIPFTPDEE